MLPNVPITKAGIIIVTILIPQNNDPSNILNILGFLIPQIIEEVDLLKYSKNKFETKVAIFAKLKINNKLAAFITSF